MTVMCSLLTDAVNNGGMKTRWNACYACHNALSNECFTSHYNQCMVCTNIHNYIHVCTHVQLSSITLYMCIVL